MPSCLLPRRHPRANDYPTAMPPSDADQRLLAASAAGDVSAIRAAVALGADPATRDAAGTPAIMLATIARATDAVQALLDAGADVDAQDAQRDNPFLYAGAEGMLDILTLANEAGADPAITNRYGGVALIPASERGHVEVVRYLLTESDVDVDHVNRARLDRPARGDPPIGWWSASPGDRAAPDRARRRRGPGRRRWGAAVGPCEGTRPGGDRGAARGRGCASLTQAP